MNMPMLQRLTISKCFVVKEFIRDMVASFRQNGASLRHLAIETEGSIIDIINSCKSLESLHITMPEYPSSDVLRSSLVDHKASLRTLALHETGLDKEREDPQLSDASELKQLCEIYPNVHYFGVQITSYDLETSEWSTGDDSFTRKLEFLALMCEFHIVHFRLPTYEFHHHSIHRNGMTDQSYQAATTNKFQSFCNVVCEWMGQNKRYLDLNGIVVGHHSYVGPAKSYGRLFDEESVNIQYPRHCFVKDYQVNPSGQAEAVAVPVTAQGLRDLEPKCELLDYDPECKWTGGLPGRLRL